MTRKKKKKSRQNRPYPIGKGLKQIVMYKELMEKKKTNNLSCKLWGLGMLFFFVISFWDFIIVITIIIIVIPELKRKEKKQVDDSLLPFIVLTYNCPPSRWSGITFTLLY